MTTPAQPRGDVRYLIGAAALVVVVAVFALTFGVVRPPAVEGLTDAQRAALPGGVAWTEFNDRGTCTDLMVAVPSGGARSIACEENLSEVLGWTDAGVITLAWSQRGEVVQTRDPATGDVTSSRDRVFDPGSYGPLDVRDSGAAADRVDGVLVVSDPPGVIWEVKADARYEIGSILLSPDREWVAMTDSAERLLVVRAGGTQAPAVWATGLGSWSWVRVVWEGTEPPGWY